jgi:hypothetical protein
LYLLVAVAAVRNLLRKNSVELVALLAKAVAAAAVTQRLRQATTLVDHLLQTLGTTAVTEQHQPLAVVQAVVVAVLPQQVLTLLRQRAEQAEQVMTSRRSSLVRRTLLPLVVVAVARQAVRLVLLGQAQVGQVREQATQQRTTVAEAVALEHQVTQVATALRASCT